MAELKHTRYDHHPPDPEQGWGEHWRLVQRDDSGRLRKLLVVAEGPNTPAMQVYMEDVAAHIDQLIEVSLSAQ
jgi:hypothetical protein